MTNLVDAVGTSRYGYSSGGMLISEDGPWEQDTVQTTVANRLRTQLTLPLPNAAAFAQTYAYDAAKRLTNTASTAGSFGYSYTRTGQGSELGLLVNGLRLPSGAYITNTFDALGRMTGTWLKNSGGTALSSHRYTYNNLYRTSVTHFYSNYVNYGYDSLGQVKSASGYEPGGGLRAQEVLGYGYDRAGNLHYRTNNELAQTFTVDTVNQLSTVTRNSTMTVAGVTTMPAASVTVNGQPATNYGDRTFAKTGMSLADGTNTFTAVAQDNKGRYDTNAITVYLPASQTFYYDANGNLTNDGRRYFFYDGDDQLTQVVVLNAWRTDFHYDGHRRKRITRDYAWQNSTWIKTNEVHYVYDGMLVIQERDANNLPIKTYTRGLDLSGSLQGAGGIGGLLAMTDHKDISTRHYYYHSDANGNVTALINEQQVVMARYAYDPFGNQIMAAGSVSGLNPYRFSSKEWHPNSGLYYYGYRFYEPNLQRWINQDPIGERGGININTFCLSDAVNNIDPFGLEITFCAEANKAFQNWIKGCICELRKSARGRELLAIVEGKNGKNIALCPGSWPGWYDDIKDKTLGVITMNPTRKNGIPRKLPTDVPKREVPPNNLKGCAVTLAHELGHAAAGDIDENEDGDGFNVRKNENPVRGQLGIKSRRSYHNFPIPE